MTKSPRPGILFLIGAFAGCLLAWKSAEHPLRWPDAKLRGWILEQTPTGSTSEQVRSFVMKQGWFDPWRQRADGVTYGPYIRGNLGKYWSGALRIYVSAIWEFNSSNQLSHVRVWRTASP